MLSEVIITSGIVSAVVSGVVFYFSSAQLEVHRTTLDIRKDLYIKVGHQLALFFSTVDDEETERSVDNLLKYFREVQIWGSDEVVRNFKKLMDLIANEDSSVEDRNIQYKEFIISIRKDVLGSTSLTVEDIDIRGHIT